MAEEPDQYLKDSRSHLPIKETMQRLRDLEDQFDSDCIDPANLTRISLMSQLVGELAAAVVNDGDVECALYKVSTLALAWKNRIEDLRGTLES